MTGFPVDCSSPSVYSNATFMEPDLYKCQRMPYFCENQQWAKQIYNIQVQQSGIAQPSAVQMAAQPPFITDPVWKKAVDKLSRKNDRYYFETPGCCSCESYLMPYYLFDNSVSDPGYPDNKRNKIILNYFCFF